MTITATFSNGYTDTYKGTRPVKAAWAIINRETGEVIASGHSLDRVKAQKTATGNVTLCVRLSHDAYPSFRLPASLVHLHGNWGKELVKNVRASGLANDVEVGKLTANEAFKRAKAANERRTAAQRALVTIEVIDL